MDPNATLAEAREALRRHHEANDAEDIETADAYAVEAARKYGALDEWLTRGGFLPTDWRGARS